MASRAKGCQVTMEQGTGPSNQHERRQALPHHRPQTTREPQGVVSPMPPRLIILSGLSRSGTSWLGKLFDSHPQTLYRHEPDSIPPWPAFPFFLDSDYADYAEALHEFVRRLPDWRVPKVLASLPTFPKAYLSTYKYQAIHATLYAIKGLAALGWKPQVPRYCLPGTQQPYVVVWKTIASSGRLGFFADVLPNKRIIHILRHPGAIVASQLRGIQLQKFDQGFKAYEDYGTFAQLLRSPAGRRSGLTLDDLKQMSPLECLTRNAVLNMENVLLALDGRPDCTLLVYEEFCANRLEAFQNLLRFCGLPWVPQVQDFLTASGSTHRSRYYSVFKDPQTTVSQWRRELSPADQAIVHAQLAASPLAALWPE